MAPTARMATEMLDAALAYLDNVTELHICSALPANYAGLAAVDLGVKASPTIGVAGNAASGRKRTVSSISDGSVTGDGTASHFALVSGTVLIAAGPLNANQAVTTGNTFTLTAFDVTMPAPA